MSGSGGGAWRKRLLRDLANTPDDDLQAELAILGVRFLDGAKLDGKCCPTNGSVFDCHFATSNVSQ